MATDPQEVQRRLLDKGMADAQRRIGEINSMITNYTRDIKGWEAKIEGLKTELSGAQEELAAIQKLRGEPIVDPGA